jgi:septal ring factor EnvC (AmiA/AmiB activator)
MRVPALVAGWVCLALTQGWAAQGKDGSLSDLDIEFTEAKVTLQTVVDENQSLKKQLAQQQEAIKSLTDSLAESNWESMLETHRNWSSVC